MWMVWFAYVEFLTLGVDGVDGFGWWMLVVDVLDA